MRKFGFIHRQLILLVAVLALAASLALPVSAAALEYKTLEAIPLIGSQPSGSDFPAYLQGLYNFAFLAIPLCALFMISVGGFMYLTSGGNTSQMGTAKEIIFDSIIGIFIAFLAWLFLYVINPDLVNINIGLNQLSTNPTPTGPGTVVPPNGNYPWPTGPQAGSGVTCNGGAITRTFNASSACLDRYQSAINTASSTYGVDKNIIRAIIYQESNGNPGAASGVGAVGLMQILPTTAQAIGCKSDWASNPESNIDCGTKYLKQGQSAGMSSYDLYAGYNGGYGQAATGASSDCPGLKRWQCSFDKADKTVCNTGYLESRNYAMEVDAWVREYGASKCSW